MRLKPLTPADCELVRQWRNENLIALRTPFMLTEEMQSDFYRDVVCDRKSNSRFWGVESEEITGNYLYAKDENGNPYIYDSANTSKDTFIGMVGLAPIQWENRLGEISIILSPEYCGKGLGAQALDLLLNEGFNRLNLENIYAECYTCNPAARYWESMCKKYSGYLTLLPCRKFWQGKYYDSIYINFSREKFNENRVSESS